ncbi:MAG: hypothetical protein IKR04_04360 [Clostridia bacterium]|nr:hypothetical protein [Clostridia bacterium]
MKKFIFALCVLFILSSCAFALELTIDGETKEYTGPNVTLVLNDFVFEVGENQMPPVIIDGRTLVPVREIFETLGGKVDWDKEAKKATIWMGENTIELEINSNLAGVNGVAKDLDVPAKIINNKTMVPVRFISENCGLLVEWDSETKTVSVNKPSKEVQPSGEELIEIETSGEENIVIAEEIPFNIRNFNEKFSKSFGTNKSINSTYQLCDYVAISNQMTEGNDITVEYTDEKGNVTSSSDFAVIKDIKVRILKTTNTRYDVSGEYREDGYLDKIIIKYVVK